MINQTNLDDHDHRYEIFFCRSFLIFFDQPNQFIRCFYKKLFFFTGVCIDKMKGCSVMLRRGFCQRNKKQMMTRCQKTCSLCRKCYFTLFYSQCLSNFQFTVPSMLTIQHKSHLRNLRVLETPLGHRFEINQGRL